MRRGDTGHKPGRSVMSNGSPHTFKTKIARITIRLFLDLLYGFSKLARLIIPKKKTNDKQDVEILITGTFHSEEWVMSFITPLIRSKTCNSVILVTTFPVKQTDGLTVVVPSPMLRRSFGDVLARLLTFIWQAVYRRPQIVGGFHISINALVANFAAALAGAHAMYVCVGGPAEIIDGGLGGESKLFTKLKSPDLQVEAKLLRTVRQFDAIVPMGNSATDYFISKGVEPERIHKITGGIDSSRFQNKPENRDIDIVFIGRLAPIKRIDLLLQVTKILADKHFEPKVRIIGRGPMEEELKSLSSKLNIDDHVVFAGFVPDITDELLRAKCFVLTSSSEGLSIAMIEAMLAGAVPVVPNVGDLGDLVEHEANGFLVSSHDAADYAQYLAMLLENEALLTDFSKAANNSALRCDIPQVAGDWDKLIASTVLSSKQDNQ